MFSLAKGKENNSKKKIFYQPTYPIFPEQVGGKTQLMFFRPYEGKSILAYQIADSLICCLRGRNSAVVRALGCRSDGPALILYPG